MPIIETRIAKIILIISLFVGVATGFWWFISNNLIPKIIFIINIVIQIYCLREISLNKEWDE